MKHNFVKGILTMLAVAVLMAIFCFGASAANTYNWSAADGAIDATTIDWTDGEVVINITGEVTLSKGITVPANASLTIKGTSGDRTVDVLKATADMSLIVQASNATGVTLKDLTLDGNRDAGIAVSLYRSNNSKNKLTVDNCVFQNAEVNKVGGGISNCGDNTVISNSLFTNITGSQGGAIYNYSAVTMTLNDVTITNCSATGNGGGVYVNKGEVYFNNVNISNCYSLKDSGGGIFVRQSSSAYLNSGSVKNCQSGYGWGIWVGGGSETTGGDFYIHEDFVVSDNSRHESYTSGGTEIGVASNSIHKVILGVDWAAEADLFTADADYTGLRLYTNADVISIKVLNDIDTSTRIQFRKATDKLIEVEGVNLGTSETPVYPVIKCVDYSGFSTSLISVVNSGVNVTMKNITFDMSLTNQSSTSNLRCVYVNPGCTLTLGSGATLKGGHVTGVGGVVSVERGTFIMEEGSLVTGGETANGGGGVAAHGNSTADGVFIMNGGTISGNICTGTTNGGGGVYATSTGRLEFNGGTISGNESALGGGVLWWGTDVVLNGTTISNNSANKGGGIYPASAGTITATGKTVISENKATSYGGGAYIGKNVVLSGPIEFIKNESSQGGGIAVFQTSATLGDGIVVSGNTATHKNYAGGGIYHLTGTDTTLTVNAITVSGNKATGTSGLGGGVYAEGEATFNGTTVIENEANSNGGGVCVVSGMESSFTDCTVTGNKAKAGAGIHVNGNCSITDCIIDGNTSQNGGALRFNSREDSDKTATITGTAAGKMSISNNTSNAYSAGLYVGAFHKAGAEGAADTNHQFSVTVTGIVDIKNNQALGGGGAGVFANGNLTLGAEDGSSIITVSDNTSTTNSGGIRIGGNTTTIYEGVTVSNNTTVTGGGICLDQDGDYVMPTLNLYGGTITGNKAEYGAGIYWVGGTLNLKGNVNVKGNLAKADDEATDYTVTNNIETSEGLKFNVTGDLTGEIGYYFLPKVGTHTNNIVIGTSSASIGTWTADNQTAGTIAVSGTDVVLNAANKTFSIKLGDEAGTVLKEIEILESDKYELLYRAELADLAGDDKGTLVGLKIGDKLYGTGAVLTAEELSGDITAYYVKVSTRPGASVKVNDNADQTVKGGIRAFGVVDYTNLQGIDVVGGMIAGFQLNAEGTLTLEDVNSTTVLNDEVTSYNAVAKKYLTQDEIGATSQAYSVSIKMPWGVFDAPVYFRAYVKVTLGGEEYVVYCQDFLAEGAAETNYKRTVKQVFEAYAGAYLGASNWNAEEGTFTGVAKGQYEFICAVIGKYFDGTQWVEGALPEETASYDTTAIPVQPENKNNDSLI